MQNYSDADGVCSTGYSSSPGAWGFRPRQLALSGDDSLPL